MEDCDFDKMIDSNRKSLRYDAIDKMNQRITALEDLKHYKHKCSELEQKLRKLKTAKEEENSELAELQVKHDHEMTVQRQKYLDLSASMKEQEKLHKNVIAELKEKRDNDIFAIVNNSSKAVNNSSLISSTYEKLKNDLIAKERKQTNESSKTRVNLDQE